MFYLLLFLKAGAAGSTPASAPFRGENEQCSASPQDFSAPREEPLRCWLVGGEEEQHIRRRVSMQMPSPKLDSNFCPCTDENGGGLCFVLQSKELIWILCNIFYSLVMKLTFFVVGFPSKAGVCDLRLFHPFIVAVWLKKKVNDLNN